MWGAVHYIEVKQRTNWDNYPATHTELHRWHRKSILCLSMCILSGDSFLHSVVILSALYLYLTCPPKLHTSTKAACPSETMTQLTLSLQRLYLSILLFCTWVRLWAAVVWWGALIKQDQWWKDNYNEGLSDTHNQRDVHIICILWPLYRPQVKAESELHVYISSLYQNVEAFLCLIG